MGWQSDQSCLPSGTWLVESTGLIRDQQTSIFLARQPGTSLDSINKPHDHNSSLVLPGLLSSNCNIRPGTAHDFNASHCIVKRALTTRPWLTSKAAWQLPLRALSPNPESWRIHDAKFFRRSLLNLGQQNSGQPNSLMPEIQRYPSPRAKPMGDNLGKHSSSHKARCAKEAKFYWGRELSVLHPPPWLSGSAAWIPRPAPHQGNPPRGTAACRAGCWRPISAPMG